MLVQSGLKAINIQYHFIYVSQQWNSFEDSNKSLGPGWEISTRHWPNAIKFMKWQVNKINPQATAVG